MGIIITIQRKGIYDTCLMPHASCQTFAPGHGTVSEDAKKALPVLKTVTGFVEAFSFSPLDARVGLFLIG